MKIVRELVVAAMLMLAVIVAPTQVEAQGTCDEEYWFCNMYCLGEMYQGAVACYNGEGWRYYECRSTSGCNQYSGSCYEGPCYCPEPPEPCNA
jgi:hypothetical protein